MTEKPKNKKKSGCLGIIGVIFLIVILINSCGKDTPKDKNESENNQPKAVETSSTNDKKEEDKKEEKPFKEQAEENALKHPATPGAVLVTKGDYEFTGMPYYFKGELLTIGTAEAFDGKTVWLVKNENGYVMPIEMLDGETADLGSTVEVWGTLSGEGYKLPNVDNVVGETGYIIMMKYNVNGE